MVPTSIAFHHFGCKVNFAEASAISRQFREKGFLLKHHHEVADIYVISSCMVTSVAEKKCRAAIHQAHRLNPDARIAVIGCLAELKAGELQDMEGVDLVLDNRAKYKLLDELEKLRNREYLIDAGHGHFRDQDEKLQVQKSPEHSGDDQSGKDIQGRTFVPSFSYGDRTRSFLKIQDGCDYYCAYCTIPLARGHSRSDSIEHVVSGAREIVAKGIREIVLTGINIGDFGRQNGENLLKLLQALEEVDGLPRIRISSIEPDLLTDEIIRFAAGSPRIMPHFHIPLQSGSDRILKAMKRKYSRDLYTGRIQYIRELLPYACIASDVITGFLAKRTKISGKLQLPGETVRFIHAHLQLFKKRKYTCRKAPGCRFREDNKGKEQVAA